MDDRNLPKLIGRLPGRRIWNSRDRKGQDGMVRPLLLLLVLGMLMSHMTACAEDVPVYAEVSTVQQLRDAVSKLKYATGGAIYLKAGTYIVTDPVVIKASNNASIFGAGMDKTVIMKKGEGNALVFSGICNNCSVRNLSIVGDPEAKAGSGIVFSETDWSGLSTIDSCRIEGFAEYGVYFAGRYQTPQSANNVTNCMLRNNRKAQIWDDRCNDYNFFRNHIVVDDKASAGAYGIYLAAGAGTIAHNYFRGCRIGVRLDYASCMNRIEYNYFDDCSESALNSGVDVPADYDITRTPREKVYGADDWANPNKIRMNTENMFCWNTVFASGTNPKFVVLSAKSTIFTTVFGNTIVADRKIRSIVNASDRNCMTWVVGGNTLIGDADKPYVLAPNRNMRIGGNTSEPNGKSIIKRPKYEISDLSRKLIAVVQGHDLSGHSWYRKVSTAEELEKAVKDVPASGGTIYITSGIYRIGAPLVIENKDNVHIMGSGPSSFLRGTGESDLLVFKGKCRNCYVGNVTIVPDKADSWHPVAQKTGSGILFQGQGEGFTVEYCVIGDWPISCVRVEGTQDNPVRNVSVLDCWIIRGQQAQLYLSGCKGFHISGNSFGNTFPSRLPIGAYFEDCSDGLYELNYHWGNKTGIQFAQGCGNIRIICNRAEQSQENGVVLGLKTGGGKPNRGFAIVGNTFHTNPELAPGDPGICSNLYASNTSDVKFIANQLYTWWDPRKFTHGAELDGKCRNWLFDGNYIRDNTERAVQCNQAKGHVFKLNWFDLPRGSR